MSAVSGRVLIIPKGAYNSATLYDRLDVVYYNAKSYVCKQPSMGNVPTNTTYWQLLCDGAINLSEMEDVHITTPANGQIMSYDATENKWENSDFPITVLSGTLIAGETTLDITDSHITDNSIIDVYTDQNGIKQPIMSISNNTLTMIFEVQSVNLTVKVVII